MSAMWWWCNIGDLVPYCAAAAATVRSHTGMSMSHKLKMFDLQRDGEVSITQQLVTLFSTLIDSGELAPGERLPATRALAADVSVNHLTAVRVYRRLAELGYVTSAVGRGTFVRQRVPVPLAPAGG